MKQAEWPKDVKKTKQRLLVYEILKQSEAPLSAMDVFAALEKQGTPVWLSTIYRVLETFSEQDMVQKTEGLDGGMALYEISLQGHKHYAVCMECRKITPLEACPLEAYTPQLPAEERSFQITGHRLQIYGYCATCRRKEEKAKKE